MIQISQSSMDEASGYNRVFELVSNRVESAEKKGIKGVESCEEGSRIFVVKEPSPLKGYRSYNNGRSE
jgi:hypothetical protein